MIRHVKHYGILLLGSLIYTCGFRFFYHPNGLVTGGVTGISMIINYLYTFLPAGIMIIVMNIPIFILGFRKLGFKFLADSAFSMVTISVLIDLSSALNFTITENPLLAAIFGGLVTGLGLGLAFSTGATTGGVDIIARILRLKYQYINIGQIILILDAVIIAAYALVFGNFDLAMTSVIAIFISAKVIDGVLYGINYGKLAYIISDAHETIGRKITESMSRGVTMLYGKGVYSGNDKTVLLCAIKRRQIVELKKIVRAEDPNAFVIISETREVFGLGFDSFEAGL